MTPKPPITWTHPLELRHTYQLLSTLPLASKTHAEVEQLADHLANARSLLELNQLIRKLRQKDTENHNPPV